ncbi:hypothetical protein ESY86_12895 [Subsaximicrobium wynnwilliamsii]|uniref:Uncharacterized protein n=1 Tax=Subsaximicrobium wynnwilliamsii TaxID=291179 RepID=A0A5C6ZIB1_9FLAO|nr:hypothetical protein [Subsaximicrobium wynnwilliamsii]TXD82676.1 hypothetical protein ESY87_12935 [Subsaximicrobium wynnwilliamsii]TXD88411.1 hypothetical protein ESY86_12895 [Subsaximicrobium wynnwilliamsii]TXE02338.1 hypothetical protein ESY88_12505 [Subsaximicrobium wynnwilliamsii]
MSKRGIELSNNFYLGLHKELLQLFYKHNSIEIKSLTVFQLYGFGNYDEGSANLKSFITEKTGKWINGKYLYNKKREIDASHKTKIKIRRDYLTILVTAAGYQGYNDYLQNSTYISADVREVEQAILQGSVKNEHVLYYVGYYVEDRRYYIKSKFTIYQLKSASWEILYWERDEEPTTYSYFGKCVPTGDSALSFYFSKEDSSLNKECFVNLFYGNNMNNKPVLLGAYCGFDRSNNPVIGKLIFEEVANAEAQNEKVRSHEINPIFHHHLYSQRLEVDGVLPHKDSDLAVSINRLEIINFLIGSYRGYYLDSNDYLIPISFQVINELGEIKLKINKTNFEGIGRLSITENYLISEFNKKNQPSYSQFSLQVQPLEKDLFVSHMLIYTGGNVINGKGLLWKMDEKKSKEIPLTNEFYINKSDIEPEKVEKINQYL